MKHDNKVREGKVIKVVNGNTIDVELKLGFGITLKQRIDLARISPFDQFSEKGQQAEQWMKGYFLLEVPDVTLQFQRHPEDANRYIAEVWDDIGLNVSDNILQRKWGTLDERLQVNVLG